MGGGSSSAINPTNPASSSSKKYFDDESSKKQSNRFQVQSQQSQSLAESQSNGNMMRPRSGANKSKDSKDAKKFKGIKPVCRSESELSLARLCINLVTLVHNRNETERNEIIRVVEKDTNWKINIEQIIKLKNYNFLVRTRNKPCVMMGTVSNKYYGDYMDVPFVCFRGQEANDDIVKSMHSVRLVPFLTHKGDKIGTANALHLKPYKKLLAAGLKEWIVEKLKMTTSSQFIITGNSIGGAWANLLTTELIVEHSRLHEKAEETDEGEDGEGATEKVVHHHHAKFYMMPDIDLFTFGAPKVFDKVTAHKLQRLAFHSRIHRYVMSGDVMATLPHGKLGLLHIGDPIFQRLDDNGWYKYPGKPTLEYDKLQYHSIHEDHHHLLPGAKPAKGANKAKAGPEDKLYAGSLVPIFSTGPNFVKRYYDALMIMSPLKEDGTDDDEEDADEDEKGDDQLQFDEEQSRKGMMEFVRLPSMKDFRPMQSFRKSVTAS